MLNAVKVIREEERKTDGGGEDCSGKHVYF